MIKYFLILLSYLMGSIPFGYLVGKYLKGIDIREYGSGNIGVANIFRIMGTKYALIVLIGDCLKGYIAVLIAKNIITAESEYWVLLIIGLFAIIGHNWSIFLNFKGGKGIATTYGVVLSFFPYIAIIAAIIWSVIVLKTKFAALGSIISVFSMIILSLIFSTPIEFKIFIVSIFIFAIIRHLNNIDRLLKKEENKIIDNKFKK
ncbi:MAG: glycerol-3-phosphate 1-O-acyltransferase PlsY [Candidatus Caldatribacteriota bacterium]|jgi:glycerol-3-phosphate acyltransferase PlsY|nr:glycerol-3-phosphate 1-O-acyltransferase PlsY [Atribacterota bacterium]MDD3031767.1 glycerol-3-phosphate 1-O-acyltransferase PlsY [Atribacterota bacterium]MDD3640206.1 glycerol-3-phosphate 1-O-acyltransferase PlsY [Atribacterota bacterium]MDD4288520.1 glycerol-3-phosphate 1-O-acyltransferase PlsY [Atribacterota bacterium]MDD4764242.1 glycerol-3-phosphate 1-O-acyltransferase PlsY [Atribacterota bacterium]